MATYFVDFVNGLDANNGLGPDASHATNKPWKTIAKLLGAAGMASGDTAYLSPAGPFREVVTVAMTSAVAETKLIGDVANVQGFKTSGGVLVAPGQVIWTAYTTNDKTAPSGTSLLNLAARDFLTFQKIMFVAGTTTMLTAGATSTNINFADCSFVSSGYIVMDITTAFATALAWVVDRCLILGPCYDTPTGPSIKFTLPLGTGADYDVNVIIRNSLILGGGIFITHSASGANKGGGVLVRNCTSFFSALMHAGTGSSSTTIPCTVHNSVHFGGGIYYGMVAGAVGQIVENYNLLVCRNPRLNITAGAQSISSLAYAPMVQFGQEYQLGARPRKFLEPMLGSPLLGFGNDGNQTAYDLHNNPRPAGGVSALPAVGVLERGNSFGRETGTVRTGSNAISITGPGYHDFTLRVEAAATEVTAYVRWDATYAGTKPKLQVLNGTECGVADATATATGSSGAWELLTLNFTPTARGIVKIRFLSSDTNGGGKMFADDLLAA